MAARITESIVLARANSDIVQDHVLPSVERREHLRESGKVALLEAMRQIDQMATIVFVRQPGGPPTGMPGRGAVPTATGPWPELMR